MPARHRPTQSLLGLLVLSAGVIVHSPSWLRAQAPSPRRFMRAILDCDNRDRSREFAETLDGIARLGFRF